MSLKYLKIFENCKAEIQIKIGNHITNATDKLEIEFELKFNHCKIRKQ